MDEWIWDSLRGMIVRYFYLIWCKNYIRIRFPSVDVAAQAISFLWTRNPVKRWGPSGFRFLAFKTGIWVLPVSTSLKAISIHTTGNGSRGSPFNKQSTLNLTPFCLNWTNQKPLPFTPSKVRFSLGSLKSHNWRGFSTIFFWMSRIKNVVCTSSANFQIMHLNVRFFS